MLIKNGVTFLWTGTNASIPTGWSRVTAMDGLYAKGNAAATNPGTTGGAATHTHTSTAHSHIAQAHTHTITINTGSGGGANNSNAGGTLAVPGHNHAAYTSGAIANFSCQSVAVTYGAFSNDPPYSTVIYITPTTGAANLPSGVVGLADGAITGMNICDGTLSTPNLVDKYLKGAAGGADAGTTGGTTTDTHDISHSHTTSHQHAAATSGTVSSGMNGTAGGSNIGQANHSHSVTPNAATPTFTDTISLVTTEVVEPSYKKLLAVQAAAQMKPPLGVIAMWSGTLATIPTGWSLYTAMQDFHLKITGTLGAVGTTGGSNTHTHASQSHSHASQAHTHAISNLTHPGGSGFVGGGVANADSNTIHAASTNSISLVLDAANTTADSSNNEPPYMTMAFIKLMRHVDSSIFLFNLV